MAKSSVKTKDIPFTGKLNTSLDPVLLRENFQQLTNLRYTDISVASIGGMTKINTTALSSYPLVRNCFQFVKDNPTEQHLLVQAYNSGETSSVILDNTTATPSQGDFGSTAVFTDSLGSGSGYFSLAPGNTIAYCNGTNSCVWAGTEGTFGSFINFDGSNNLFDFTEALSNTQQNTINTALLNGGVSTGLDGDTGLLLHLDNNVTDSSLVTAHTVTNNAVTFDAGVKKFGTHSALFNAAGAYLSIPDNDDFNFSGGKFTIDAWVRITSLATWFTIYRQVTGSTNQINFYIATDGKLRFSLVNTSSIGLVGVTVLSLDTFYHVAVVEDGNNYYMYLNGVLEAHASNTMRAADQSATVYLGYNSDGSSSLGYYLDELRVSKAARWVSNFVVPASAYSNSAAASYAYLGTLQPLKGFKAYVKTPNTAASTLTVEYWSGTAWVTCGSLVDGTSSGGISLAQTGEVTFLDTETSAKIKVINSLALFYYRLTWSSVTVGTSLYYFTTSASMQQVQDIWDGIEKHCISFYKYASSVYNDLTINIYEEDYSSANTASFANLNSLAATTDYLLCGFSERQTAINFTLVGSSVNSTAATSAAVYYWSGSAWVAVSGLTDGTSVGSISFARSGNMSWSAPSRELEFKQSFTQGIPLFYYKVVFDKALSAAVSLDLVTGIPAQRTLGKYKFPVMSQNRLLLCGDTTKNLNTAIESASNTYCVFNGDDSTEFIFGGNEELTAGAALYVQLGSSYENIKVFFKNFETWIVIGTNPNNYNQYQSSDSIGCVAPNTLKTINVGSDVVQGTNRYVLIFQSSFGIHLFDGKTFYLISGDIENLWDVNASTKINPSMINKSSGFFDYKNNEYHFLCATGSNTTLNKEYVYDFIRQKWYEVDRGTGKELQTGLLVKDTNGYSYNYGFIDTGYCERLEYGTSFDGAEIVSTVWFGDMILSDSLLGDSIIRLVKLGLVKKTTGDITLTHYGDTSTTGTEISLSVESSNRCTFPGKTHNLGNFISHSFKMSYTSSTESIGFEPLIFGLEYKLTGVDRD